MQTDAQFNSYQHQWAGGVNNRYLFTTADSISYEVRFVPSDYLFDAHPSLQARFFEMVIAVVDNPSGKRLPADPLPAPTILEIFYRAFL